MSEPRKIEVGKYYRHAFFDGYIYKVKEVRGEYIDNELLIIIGQGLFQIHRNDSSKIDLLGKEISKEEVEAIKAGIIEANIAKVHEKIDPF